MEGCESHGQRLVLASEVLKHPVAPGVVVGVWDRVVVVGEDGKSTAILTSFHELIADCNTIRISSRGTDTLQSTRVD
ncbi:hypothetical protein EYF80_001038 [Liparis tanakae]|uniref:Uncharacterized protein n=1 Tax=Liparis tanakae TaxID=230148 RepID=A0A4Z2JEN5_9TELE|nr:hypothetical protein EYF80_001038 [Liparis tanakae]